VVQLTLSGVLIINKSCHIIGSEKYYRTSVDIVDGLLDEAKKTVVVQGSWKDTFKVK